MKRYRHAAGYAALRYADGHAIEPADQLGMDGAPTPICAWCACPIELAPEPPPPNVTLWSAGEIAPGVQLVTLTQEDTES